MATLEERLTAVEHEQAELKQDNTKLKQTNTELKQKIELQTIAIGALVDNAMLERLNEKNDKVFDALIAHDQFTNAQLAELRDHQIELDGKFVGLQIEMRQRFEQQDTRFDRLESLLTQVIARLPQQS